MASTIIESLGSKLASGQKVDLAKAAALFALLLLFAWAGPLMPPFFAALFWAALSAASAIGLTYHAVIRKARNQFMLKSGGKAARINNGRIISLIVSFVVSAVLVAGLVFESPKWGIAEWVVVAAAIPLYGAVYLRMKRLVAGELEPLFQKSKAVLWSSAIVGALLCLAYLAICIVEPTIAYPNATEAFLGAKQPFANSPSALLSETGKLVALVDGVTAYGLSKASEVSFGLYLFWRIVISASAFFGVASLLGTCALKLKELKLVFLPLDAVKDPDEDVPVAKRFVAIACALPLVLVAGFLIADFKVAQVAETEEYTAAESLVRDNVGLAAYVIDGKYYDQQKAQELMDAAHEASVKLAAEREEVLVPLINEAYDKRLANVDPYLDWYYSLPADYERLLQYFAGTVESGMQEQLTQRINQGVDESVLAEKFEYYLEQSEALKTNLIESLQQYEIDSVPLWLVVPVESAGTNSLAEPLAPTQQFLDAAKRAGLSVGIGAIAGVIATKAAQKILARPFFKKIVGEVLEKLAIRGLLAEGGTAIAPGVGTVVGVGVGFVADYLFLKADEAMNRASYKTEIVGAIEDSRAEMLALVAAAG